jgi:hypothetical protein
MLAYHHEHVCRSSLATVSRYRTATQHLVNFYPGARAAHKIDAEAFIYYLRRLRVWSPTPSRLAACTPRKSSSRTSTD